MAQVNLRKSPAQRGLTLVEILVTLVILAIGLLGLVALQARVQVLQAEAYQRAQALMLLKDMSSRIANNRNGADDYRTTGSAPLAEGNCPAPGATRASVDRAEWCLALQGASEQVDGANVGAMVGGRGCIDRPNPGEYRVTVAWQGLAPIAAAAPPADLTCGAGSYGAVGTPCEGDLCRRVVTTIVILPELT